MNTVHNERVKYFATWLNTIASAAVVVGVVAPLAAAFYGTGGVAPPTPALTLGAVIWFLSGLALHLAARRVLGGLRS